MLVLTRKLNQSITLGDNVRLTILSIENDRVSIGVDAPREVRIFRSELLEGTRKSNQESFASQYIPVKMMTGKGDKPGQADKKDQSVKKDSE